jgi:hypothetical protein
LYWLFEQKRPYRNVAKDCIQLNLPSIAYSVGDLAAQRLKLFKVKFMRNGFFRYSLRCRASHKSLQPQTQGRLFTNHALRMTPHSAGIQSGAALCRIPMRNLDVDLKDIPVPFLRVHAG